MNESSMKALDEIDREILRILSENPRAPYKELSEKLLERGHEMSGEGIRYRVQTLLEATSTFFLLSPAEQGWQIIRMCIEVKNKPGATTDVYNEVNKTDAWLVCRGFGSFDIWAVGTTRSDRRTRKLLTEIRELPEVNQVSHFVETARQVSVEDYLSFE